MRIAILGAGGIADFHARALQRVPGAKVVAVCDQQTARAEAFQAKWGIPDTFDSTQAMLQAAVPEVVHVLVPPAAHAKAAIPCLEAGCHVFLEKPAAVSGAECDELAAAAERTGRRIGVNHNLTCSPTVVRLREAARERHFGRIEHVTVVYNLPLKEVPPGHWIFQDTRNIVLELAAHPLSILHCFVGETLTAATLVSGERTLSSGAKFYDTWQASLNCTQGTGQLFFSVGRDYLETWVHIIGQDGSALADLRRNTLALSGKSAKLGPYDDLRQCAAAPWSVFRDGVRNFKDYLLGSLRLKPAYDLFFEPLAESIGGFYRALAEGRMPPVSIQQGAAVVRACERIVSSGETFMRKTA